MENELTITKENTARFVHNAVEMESAIFTIDRAIEECKRQKKKVLEDAERKEYEERTPIRERQANIAYWEKSKATCEDSYSSKGIGVALVIGCIIGAIIFPILSGNLSGILLGSFLGGTIVAGGKLMINTHKQNNYIADCDYKISVLQKEIDYLEDKVKASKAEHNKQIRQPLSVLDSQIAELNAKRDQIQSNLSRFYDLNVIPPDYRYMDCAIILDQIFRNDLADTMREAVMLYEERVYRGEVIKGMDKIYSMLGNLSAGMVAIEQRLSSINSTVEVMSQDLERIVEGQKKQLRATDELIHETQMSRYANEQAATSARNLEWYQLYR